MMHKLERTIVAEVIASVRFPNGPHAAGGGHVGKLIEINFLFPYFIFFGGQNVEWEEIDALQKFTAPIGPAPLTREKE